MKTILSFGIVIALGGIVCAPLCAETIKFKNGKVLEGTIVERTSDYIKFDDGSGIALTYYLDELDLTEGDSQDQDRTGSEPTTSDAGAKELFDQGFALLENYEEDPTVALEAQQYFKELSDKYPKSAYSYLGWSHLYQKMAFDGKRYDGDQLKEKALPYALMAVKLDPHLPRAHNRVGDVYRVLGEFEQAEGAIRTAIQMAPNDPKFYKTLGDLYDYQGPLKALDAIEAYEQALVRNPPLPQKAEIYYRMGNVIKNKLDGPQKAISYFQKAIELKKDFARAYNNLGWAHKELEQYDEAIDAFKRAQATRPYKLAQMNEILTRGLKAEEEKDYDAATQYFLELVELDKPTAFYYNKIGFFYRVQNDYPNARKYFELAIEDDKDYVYPYYNLARMTHDEGDNDNALVYINQAIEADPSYAPNYSHKGRILNIMKRMDEAVEAYRQHMRLAPDSEDSKWLRANVPPLKNE